MKLLSILSAVLFGTTAVAATAGNTLVKAGVTRMVAKSTLSALPETDWNRVGHKEGGFVEIWTKDGDALNKIMFISSLPIGQPLFTPAKNAQRALPTLSTTTTLSDIPALLENSYRSKFDLRIMTVEEQEPLPLAGHPGVRFTYRFVQDADGIERRGEALGTLVSGRLYLVTYDAPTIYYFQKDLAAFRKITATLKL